MLLEVRVLAISNHPNVLRYFNSWIEITYDKNKSDNKVNGNQNNICSDDFLISGIEDSA